MNLEKIESGNSAQTVADKIYNNDIKVLNESYTLYNVTHSHPLQSGYYTQQEARKVVPVEAKKRGVLLTYQTVDGWITEQYVGSVWDEDSSWLQIEDSEQLYKKHVGNLFNIIGYIKPNTDGLVVDDNNFRCTDFLPVSQFNNLTVTVYGGATVCPLMFFDENKKNIGEISLSTWELVDKTITSAEIPDNAAYIRASINRTSQSKGKITGINISTLVSNIHKQIEQTKLSLSSELFNLSKHLNKYDYTSRIVARSQVPKEKRVSGLVITYKLNGKWVLEQYNNDANNADNWGDLASWQTNVSERILTYETDVATTRKQLIYTERERGVIITYFNTDTNELITEQYIGTTKSETDFVSNGFWVRLETEKTVQDKFMGNLYTNTGYPHPNNGKIINDNNFVHTGFLPITGKDNITVTGGNPTTVPYIAYFDKDRKYIGCLTDSTFIESRIILSSDIPYGAKFIISSLSNNKQYVLPKAKLIGCNISALATAKEHYTDARQISINSKVFQARHVILPNGDMEGNNDYISASFSPSTWVELTDGENMYYSGEIDNGYMPVIFMNKDMKRICTGCLPAGIHRRSKIEKPFGAKYAIYSSRRNESIEKGIFEGEDVENIHYVVKKFSTIFDLKNDKTKNINGVSKVGAYLFSNNNNLLLGNRNKQVVSDMQLSEEKTTSHFLLWWDDKKGEGLFRGNKTGTIFISSDFTNFEEIKVVNTGYILNARPTFDGKYLVCIKTPDDKATIGGVYKGDKNGFTKKITWSTNTATHIEHWAFNTVGKTVLINEYDATDISLRQTTCAYISFDSGDTFTKIFDFHASRFYQDVIAEHPDSKGAAHIHGCCYDPFENRAWLTTGDMQCKWVLYSDPITNVNNVTWNGIYLDSQMCPLHATYNGIIGGTDHNDNAMYIFHRDIQKEVPFPYIDNNHEPVYDLAPEKDTIRYVPGIITDIDGVMYAPCCAWRVKKDDTEVYLPNKVVASVDGINWKEVWISDKPRTGNNNCKIFPYKGKLLVFDCLDSGTTSTYRILIFDKPEMR